MPHTRVAHRRYGAERAEVTTFGTFPPARSGVIVDALRPDQQAGPLCPRPSHATLADYEARAKTTPIGPVYVTVLDDGASHLVYIDGDGIAVNGAPPPPGHDWEVDIAAVGVTVTFTRSWSRTRSST